MAVKIGAQMFTLRDHCKTPSDIAKSCARVKAMGYDGIQASAAGFNEIPAAELRKILDDNGLACAATHVGLDKMKSQTQQVIDDHKTLGCAWTAIGGFYAKDNWTLAAWQGFIDDYNAVAKQFVGSGVGLGYHNHSHELAPVEGVTALQRMVDGLDKSIWFEIDTYWIAHGGGDPAQWIDKVASRIPCVHIKDMTVTPQREHKMCEVGSGNLNWPRILEACRNAGVEWYLVERDTGDLDPFDSLKISIDNMRSWGL